MTVEIFNCPEVSPIINENDCVYKTACDLDLYIVECNTIPWDNIGMFVKSGSIDGRGIKSGYSTL